MRAPEPSPRQLLDAATREYFPLFVALAFSAIYPGVTLKPNWHIDCVAWHLQEMYAGKVDRHVVLNMPPRSLKTFVVAICFPAWLLLRDPSLSIIVASYGDDLSRKVARDFRALMESALMTRLSGGHLSNPRKFTESEFETDKGGGRFATSVGGTLTGRGADVLIIDDPLKADEGLSETMRRAATEWFNTSAHSRQNRPGKTLLIVSMQRLHADDLAGHLIAKGWPSLVMPSRAMERGVYDVGGPEPYIREPGTLLQPDWDDPAALDAALNTIGSYAFSAQYQQMPEPEGGNMIKREWLKTYATPPPREECSQVYVVCDPAGKAGEHNDFSAIVVASVVKRSIYVLEVRRGHWDALRIKGEIEALAQRWRATRVVIETTGMGEGVRQEMQRQGRFLVVGAQPTADKATRLSRNITRFELGFVTLPEHAPWLTEFVGEILGFPNAKNDDQLDALVLLLEDLAKNEPYDYSGVQIDVTTFYQENPFVIR